MRNFRASAAFLGLLTLLWMIPSCARHKEKPFVPPHSIHMKIKMQIHDPGSQKNTQLMETWYTAPDRYRSDSYYRNGVDTFIINRKLVARYAADSQAIVHTPVTPEMLKNMPMNPSPKTPADYARSLGRGWRIAGTKTVAGRTCIRIESPIIQKEQAIYCIDRKTGVILSQSYSFDSGTSSMNTATVFQPNISIPDSIFQPKPPENTPIIQAPFSSEALSTLYFPLPKNTAVNNILHMDTVDLKITRNQSAVISDLRSIRKENNLKGKLKELYTPAYVPARFRLLKVLTKKVKLESRNGLFKRTSFNEEVFDGIEINYIDPKTGDMLILIESAKRQKRNPSAVAAASFDGKISAKTDPFPYVDLTWERNGVFFRLGAVNIDKAELIKIAKSLQIVH